MADPPPGEEEEDGMTMLEHLEELRVRIIVCAVALVLGLVISAVPIPYVTDDSVTQAVIHIISLPRHGHLIFIKPGEGFVTYFQVAMIVAIVLALPVMTYQAIAFVLPALLPHEKKYLYLAIPGAMISFTIGLLFGYILLLPVAIQFLLNFGYGQHRRHRGQVVVQRVHRYRDDTAVLDGAFVRDAAADVLPHEAAHPEPAARRSLPEVRAGARLRDRCDHHAHA